MLLLLPLSMLSTRKETCLHLIGKNVLELRALLFCQFVLAYRRTIFTRVMICSWMCEYCWEYQQRHICWSWIAGRSPPTLAKYGKYYTLEEIHDIFAPADAVGEAVKEWLRGPGIEDSRIVHSDNKGWIAFYGSAEEAERLFKTEYYEHEHKANPNIRVGCDEWFSLIWSISQELTVSKIPCPRKFVTAYRLCHTRSQAHSCYQANCCKVRIKVHKNHKINYSLKTRTKSSIWPRSRLQLQVSSCFVPSCCSSGLRSQCHRRVLESTLWYPRTSEASQGYQGKLSWTFRTGDYFAKSDINAYMKEFSKLSNLSLNNL